MAEIVINKQTFPVKVVNTGTNQSEFANKFLSRMQSIACGIHTLGAVSPQFSVVGELRKQYFVVHEIVK